jgi:hypothetical protein
MYSCTSQYAKALSTISHASIRIVPSGDGETPEEISAHSLG